MIVEASPRTALTPNFRALEYAAPDGSIRVHRDLVAAVQMLRDRTGPLRIVTTAPRGVPRGIGAVVAHAATDTVVIAAEELRASVLAERPDDETSLTRIALEERARRATLRFRADCLSRRLGILYREPRRVTLDGITSRRTNRRLYLVRDAEVHSVERFLAPPLLRDVG